MIWEGIEMRKVSNHMWIVIAGRDTDASLSRISVAVKGNKA